FQNCASVRPRPGRDTRESSILAGISFAVLRVGLTVKPTSHSFSTDLVPAPDRLAAWRWTAKQICGDSRFQFPKTNLFHGSIERRNLAGLEFTRFASSSVAFAKFPVVSPRADDRGCI